MRGPPDFPSAIPVSVVAAVRGEAARIERCLAALKGFSEIVAVDSDSTDGTAEIARRAGARVVPFSWDGRYPKKRQWCLDRLDLKHDWVLFVDADEIVTPELADEIRVLFSLPHPPPCAGYFIDGLYAADGRILRHGLRNRKIALLDRRAMAFPAVDDLDLPGMGEMEGHYQPVPWNPRAKIGKLRHPMLHETDTGGPAWQARHERYAAWEAGMNRKNAWPQDPVPWRQALKAVFRALPFRPAAAFLHSYILKAGFLDGKPGWRLARSRALYYAMIKRLQGQQSP